MRSRFLAEDAMEGSANQPQLRSFGGNRFGMTGEPESLDLGPKTLGGATVRVGDQRETPWRQHLVHDVGDEWNKSAFIEHVRPEDQRVPLIGQLAPVEPRGRRQRGIETIRSDTAAPRIPAAPGHSR